MGVRQCPQAQGVERVLEIKRLGAGQVNTAGRVTQPVGLPHLSELPNTFHLVGFLLFL